MCWMKIFWWSLTFARIMCKKTKTKNKSRGTKFNPSLMFPLYKYCRRIRLLLPYLLWILILFFPVSSAIWNGLCYTCFGILLLLFTRIPYVRLDVYQLIVSSAWTLFFFKSKREMEIPIYFLWVLINQIGFLFGGGVWVIMESGFSCLEDYFKMLYSNYLVQQHLATDLANLCQVYAGNDRIRICKKGCLPCFFILRQK